MWRIRGERKDGQPTYIVLDVTADDRVAIHTPEPVILEPSRALRLLLVLSEAIDQATFRRRR